MALGHHARRRETCPISSVSPCHLSSPPPRSKLLLQQTARDGLSSSNKPLGAHQAPLLRAFMEGEEGPSKQEQQENRGAVTSPPQLTASTL